MEFINDTSAKLSLDYQQSEEYQSSIKWERLWFLIHYVIIIPFLLFLLSRLMRCIRHRGWISRGSERRIVADMKGRLTSVAAGATTSVNGGLINFGKRSASIPSFPSSPSSAASSSPTISFCHPPTPKQPQPDNK